MGFKNAKKGSNVAAQTAAMDVAQVTEKSFFFYRCTVEPVLKGHPLLALS